MTTEIKLVRTLERSATTVRRSSVWSPFGPVNPGSTTLRAQEIHRENQEAQLMELLNSLEKEVVILQSRLYTVYDMLNDATQRVYSVLRLGTPTDVAGTDE